MNMINIKNRILKEKIYYQLKKENTDELTIDNIKEITSISLNGIDIDGDKIVYDVQELKILENLNTITLTNILINDEVIDVINSFIHLKLLILNECNFISTKSINVEIVNLIIVGGKNSDLSIFQNLSKIKSLKILYNDEFDINNVLKMNNLEEFYLGNSTVKNITNITKLKNLKILNLDGSKLDDNYIIDKLDKNIEVSFEAMFMYKD